MRLYRNLPKLRNIKDLGGFSTPKDIKGNISNALHFRYTPHLCLPISAPQKLSTHHHPCRLVVKSRYETRPEPFLWYMIASKDISGKQGTIRNWLTRRVRVAFTKAMQDLEYNKDGTKVSKPATKKKPELRGTATITILAGIFECPPEKLHSDCTHALNFMIDQCSKIKEESPRAVSKKSKEREVEIYSTRGQEIQLNRTGQDRRRK